MSLVDRQHEAQQAAASQTAPAAPVTPVAPPPAPPPPVQAPEAKPYKHLVVIAAVLVLVAVVTSCAILFARNQTDPKGTTAPPPATSAPSSTPTLSAKQQAAAEAIDRYTAYVRAVEDTASKGSPKADVDKLADEYTVDPMRTFTIESGERGRAGKYSSTGYTKVTARVDSITSLSAKTPVATLTTCEDSTGRTITKAGKPIPRTFQFVKSTVTMKRVGGVWKVANTVNPNEPNRKSCTV